MGPLFRPIKKPETNLPILANQKTPAIHHSTPGGNNMIGKLNEMSAFSSIPPNDTYYHQQQQQQRSQGIKGKHFLTVF